MIPLKKAKEIILSSVFALKIEKVRLAEALDRVLAKDIIATIDSPEFDRSTMDGFALACSDAQEKKSVLKCVEFISAGRLPGKKLKRGECSKIATGAVLPAGADSVVVKEKTRVLPTGRVEIYCRVKKGENVLFRASHFKKGALLLKKGVVLNAARAGLLASIGLTKVKVFALPSVAIIATGNEVVEPGNKKTRNGRIWNSSVSMLEFALKRLNISPRYLGIARDELEPLYKKIQGGLKYDILIITGAVSEGDLDFVPSVLKKTGAHIEFHKVAVRPGKPLLFAKKGKHLVFGLPGNPVSSLVSFLLFVAPLIKRKSGFGGGEIFERGILTKEAYNDSGRTSFFPARILKKAGRIFVSPLNYRGSADLMSVSGADAFFQVKSNARRAKNSEVEFLRIGS